MNIRPLEMISKQMAVAVLDPTFGERTMPITSGPAGAFQVSPNLKDRARHPPDPPGSLPP